MTASAPAPCARGQQAAVKLLAYAAVAYLTVGLPVGVVEAVIYRRSGGNVRGTLAWGALATIAGPPLLAHAAWDWFR